MTLKEEDVLQGMIADLKSNLIRRFEQSLKENDYRSSVTIIFALRAIGDGNDQALEDAFCEWDREEH